MTDRNELERLLAAATEGPWEAEYDPINDGDHATAICIPGYAGQFGTFLAYCQHNWNDAMAGDHRISWKEATANAALICFLRNNAQHYLSLMGEVERLREALRDMADSVAVWSAPPSHPTRQRDPVHQAQWDQLREGVGLILTKALGETK